LATSRPVLVSSLFVPCRRKIGVHNDVAKVTTTTNSVIHNRDIKPINADETVVNPNVEGDHARRLLKQAEPLVLFSQEQQLVTKSDEISSDLS
jgi:hypothetical protein